jgi:ribonuclease T1
VRFSAGSRCLKLIRQSGLASALASVVLLTPLSASSWSTDPAPSGSGQTIVQTDLPPQAVSTLGLIHQGGPFPYPKDGVVFGNRERLLPNQYRGYYHEYTVPTPGEHHRGAQRIVCGGRQVTQPDACFYTVDHYASFKRIVQ